MFAATIAMAFVAGVLSALSPCVLPLLPLVFAGAASKNKFAPILLALGVALSFSAIGIIIATIGFSAGLNEEYLKNISALVMIAFGFSIFLSSTNYYASMISSTISNSVQKYLDRISVETHWGSFATGCLLGAVWSPCAGPTLGSATLLASQRESFAQVSMTMISYGVGATFPLLFIGMTARRMAYQFRSNLVSVGLYGKSILGISLISIGGVIISGMDKIIENQIVLMMPDWLISLTTVL